MALIATLVLLQHSHLTTIAHHPIRPVIMDRPQSQLENMRPTGIKPPTGLKPPTRVPSALLSGVGRTLTETSQSDLNARSVRDGQMGPPPSTIKHKPSGCELGLAWDEIYYQTVKLT